MTKKKEQKLSFLSNWKELNKHKIKNIIPILRKKQYEWLKKESKNRVLSSTETQMLAGFESAKKGKVDQSKFVGGQEYLSSIRYCPNCKRKVRGVKKIGLMIILHIMLAIVTYGLWIIIYLAYYFLLKPRECPMCRTKL